MERVGRGEEEYVPALTGRDVRARRHPPKLPVLQRLQPIGHHWSGERGDAADRRVWRERERPHHGG